MERVVFDDEHEVFRESARRYFKERVGPHVDRWRTQGIVDRSAFLDAGEQGYLCMWVDEKYGGAGVSDFRYEQVLIEENLRYGDYGFYIHLHSRLVAPYIGRLGTPDQLARFLPGFVSGERILGIAMTESGAGSDLAGIQTRAARSGNGWKISGSKTYISNGQLGDVFVVVARTIPDKRHGLGLFLIERDMPGFRRGRNLQKMGLDAQDTSELFFDDVQVPAENVLGDPTQGFHYLTQFLAEERLVGACMYLAHAQTAFDITLDYVKERRAFGRPIGSFQNTRFVLADLRAQLDSVQAFIDHCVVLHNQRRLTAEGAAEAKLLTSELEGKVVDACVQFHGGAGYMAEYRISRMYTDARISRIYAGSSEIMKEIIGRGLGLDDRKLK
jgi:alkylation response protein AidB-like acyl-CoA dehydrogenase